MKTISRQPNCSGCGACQNICSQNAITMLHELESTYPIVNKKCCIECGMCVNVCPLYNTVKTSSIYPKVYACSIKDTEVLKKSTSGGAFIAFSNFILSQGGIVFGAVSGEDFRVNICAVEKEDGLAAMQGSKYVESNTNLTFRQVKNYLTQGRICLYSALPCQIAGLLSYLETCKISRENLYTIDLVCHGTPSEVLYLSWLKNYEKTADTALIQVWHRYKHSDWNSMVPKECAYICANGKFDIHDSNKDGYMNGFLQRITYKNSCYSCKYAHMPRLSDITLGDFTGLGAAKKSKNNFKGGVSQVLINTEKGQKLFNSITNYIIHEKRELYEALFFNTRLWNAGNRPAKTDNFFTDFSQDADWVRLRKRYLDRNFQNRVNTFVKALIPKIFGARLTVKTMYILKKKKRSPSEAMESLDCLFKNY